MFRFCKTLFCASCYQALIIQALHFSLYWKLPPVCICTCVTYCKTDEVPGPQLLTHFNSLAHHLRSARSHLFPLLDVPADLRYRHRGTRDGFIFHCKAAGKLFLCSHTESGRAHGLELGSERNRSGWGQLQLQGESTPDVPRAKVQNHRDSDVQQFMHNATSSWVCHNMNGNYMFQKQKLSFSLQFVTGKGKTVAQTLITESVHRDQNHLRV